MGMISTIRSVLEILYFCSAIALAMAAVIGLRQLKISRENTLTTIETAKTSARRESFKLAAEQCAYYYGHMIPIINKFHEWIAGNKLGEVIEAVDVEVTADGILRQPKDASAISNYLDCLMKEPQHFLSVMNAAEGFSIMFSAGVASEKVGFSSIGNTFCHSLKQLVPGGDTWWNITFSTFAFAVSHLVPTN